MYLEVGTERAKCLLEELLHSSDVVYWKCKEVEEEEY